MRHMARLMLRREKPCFEEPILVLENIKEGLEVFQGVSLAEHHLKLLSPRPVRSWGFLCDT